MMRRLFYLLPGNKQAAKLAVDLEINAAINPKNIHAVVQNKTPIVGINDIQCITEQDKDEATEWWAWRIDLTLFFLALLAFLIMLVVSPTYWLIIPLVIMLLSLFSGFFFAIKVPHVHIREHHSAIHHGETLMMVDVKPKQVYGVGHFIQQHHPEAVSGGVSWHR